MAIPGLTLARFAMLDVPMATNTPRGTSTGSLDMFTIPRKPATTSTTAMSKALTAGEDAMLLELQKINATLSSQNPVADQELSSFKANTLLQFLGILAATVFGVFSILAWLAATKSNEISTSALNQALQSNQLALLAYCVSGGKNTSAAAICVNVLSQASGEVAPIVESVLPNVPTSTTSVFSTSAAPPTTSESSVSTASSSSVQITETTAPSSVASFATTFTTAPPVSATSSSVPTSAGNGSATTNVSGATPTVSATEGSTSSSSIGGANTAAIIGGLVGAIAGIAAVFLCIWRRRAYKEMLGRGHAQEREKDSEAM